MDPAPFKDQVTILTGSSSGIEAALARQLAVQDTTLALAMRDAARLSAVPTGWHAQGARVMAIPTDVTDAQAHENLIAKILLWIKTQVQH